MHYETKMLIVTKTIRKNHCHAHFLRIIFRGLESLIINVPFVRNKKTLLSIVKDIGDHKHYLKVRGGLNFYQYFTVSFKKYRMEDLLVTRN